MPRFSVRGEWCLSCAQQALFAARKTVLFVTIHVVISDPRVSPRQVRNRPTTGLLTRTAGQSPRLVLKYSQSSSAWRHANLMQPMAIRLHIAPYIGPQLPVSSCQSFLMVRKHVLLTVDDWSLNGDEQPMLSSLILTFPRRLTRNRVPPLSPPGRSRDLPRKSGSGAR